MCISPITMRHPVNGKIVTFPCGRCAECVQKYQADWTFRLEQEFRNWPKAYFLTLTYRNENIPYVTLKVPESRKLYFLANDPADPDFMTESEEVVRHPDALDYVRHRIDALPESKHLLRARARKDAFSSYLCADEIVEGIPVPVVSREDVQAWLKRLRERYRLDYGERPKFKYFLCSEYGPNTFRPHYHIIVFCDFSVSEFSEYFVQSWQQDFGEVHWKYRPIYWRHKNGVGDVMAYVAKYCSKPSFVENPYVVAGILPRPFRLVSKRMGFSFMKDLHYRIMSYFDNPKFRSFNWMNPITYCFPSFQDHLNQCFLQPRNGYAYRIPRYYIDKFFPHRRYITVYYDTKKHKSSLRTSWRKDPDNIIWTSFKDFIQSQYTHRVRQELQAVALANFGSVSLEAQSAAASSINQARLDSYKAKVQKLCDFYAKGFVYEL